MKSSTSSLHFFSFPGKDDDRCDQWIMNSGKEVLLEKTAAQKGNYVVCQRHFTDDSFTNSLHNRLNKDAVPTLDGNAVHEPVEIDTAGDNNDPTVHYTNINVTRDNLAVQRAPDSRPSTSHDIDIATKADNVSIAPAIKTYLGRPNKRQARQVEKKQKKR